MSPQEALDFWDRLDPARKPALMCMIQQEHHFITHVFDAISVLNREESVKQLPRWDDWVSTLSSLRRNGYV